MYYDEEPFEWSSELNALLYASRLVTKDQVDFDKARTEAINRYGSNRGRMTRTEFQKFRQQVVEQVDRTNRLKSAM